MANQMASCWLPVDKDSSGNLMASAAKAAPPTHPSIHPSIYPSTCPSICPSKHFPLGFFNREK
ncbi:hypothetical protein INR49_007745 [Caranx melampygus]|nr:hypothetical protein INR49_007745 [Caranx melampygus]